MLPDGSVEVVVRVRVNRAQWATEYGIPETDRAVREDVIAWLGQLAGNEPPLFVTRVR